MIYYTLIFWYLYLGFLTACILTSCDITIGHSDVDDVLNVKNGKDYLVTMLLWPAVAIVGFLVGIFKLIHWSSKPLFKLLDFWVHILKGQ
jgi:hypothetical protein